MKIAKIVSSNSHIDYIARVIDEVEGTQSQDDYLFGQFVAIEIDTGKVIGVIYDSRVINPEYSMYGPRLDPKPSLGSFRPERFSEQSILLGILLLGTLDENGGSQGVPKRIVPPGQDVSALEPDDLKRFHADPAGSIHIHYYPQIVAHAGIFALPLLDSIVGRLSTDCSDEDRQRLSVLRRSLAWQGTFGGLRL